MKPGPVQKRLVTDFDRYEAVCRKAFATIGAKRASRALVLTEHPRNPTSARLRTAELMFESIGVPAGYVWTQAALAMYSTGRTTGCVVDCGVDCAHAVVLIDGNVLRGATRTVDVGGWHVTKRMAASIINRGAAGPQYLSPGAGLARVEAWKRRYAYAAGLIKEEVRRFRTSGTAVFAERNRKYRLPDGTAFDVGSEAFLAPEALFHPDLLSATTEAETADAIRPVLSLADPGLAAQTSAALHACGEELVFPVSRNVVVAGGTSLLHNFQKRMHHNLQLLSPPRCKVVVRAPRNRRHATWTGGSIVATMPTFKTMWITKAMYDESGQNVVLRHCTG